MESLECGFRVIFRLDDLEWILIWRFFQALVFFFSFYLPNISRQGLIDAIMVFERTLKLKST